MYERRMFCCMSILTIWPRSVFQGYMGTSLVFCGERVDLVRSQNGFDLAFVTSFCTYAVLRVYGIYHHRTPFYRPCMRTPFSAL